MAAAKVDESPPVGHAVPDPVKISCSKPLARHMKFSIVIPTRNRSSLLGHAIRSALCQTFEDYELVVSNNRSTDRTDAVIEEFHHPRIAFHRPDRILSMVDHWEYALGKARGRWVLYLCDDDALLPDCLSYLDSLTEQHPGVSVIQYANSVYVYGDGIEASGNYLRLKKSPRKKFEVIDSIHKLKSVFRTMSGDMPKFLNCVVKMDLVDKIRQGHERVFHNWAPDYSSGVLLLAHTVSYLRLHEPLMLWGRNVRSYGSGSRVDPDHFLTFLREFEEFDGCFRSSPYPDLIVLSNMIYDTLHRIRERLDDRKEDLDVDPCVFRSSLVEDIRCYLREGHDRYAEHLETVERDLRTMTPSYMLAYRRRASRGLGRLYARFKRRREEGGIILGSGVEPRFENIYEAAQFLWRIRRCQRGPDT